MLKLITENWQLKAISLAFALVLWFSVMGERKLEIGFTVPLELKNVPEGMMVASEVPSQVDVRLSGPRTMLLNLGPKDIRIAVELNELKPGLTSFRRLEERLDIPAGIKVTRLSPSFVDIKLERIRNREIPVKVVFSGRLAEGYRVARVVVEPATVNVEGADGELRELAEVQTDVVDLGGLSADRTLTVPINYRGRYTQLKGATSVEVTVEVEKSATVKKKPRSS
ncbi:MAG: YbbR domain pair protein [Desulfuromonadales bacterium GWD2_61_12]|nr:MAG: YbbR domain pair protein [Desulfuromonadales bacterium GWD2_61_12]HBT84185.1 YbbR domain pair protein [Desulfuromonas sp.]